MSWPGITEPSLRMIRWTGTNLKSNFFQPLFVIGDLDSSLTCFKVQQLKAPLQKA